MKLDWLLYFKEVAKAEHLGRASTILRVSPSAVSRAINLLEDEIGTALFEHYGRRIRLTLEGRRLYERILMITADIDSLPSDIGKTSRLSGSYRIMASNVLSQVMIAPALCELFRVFSEFKCDLRSARSADVIGGLLRNECDLGLCFSPQAHPELEMVPLFKGQLYLVVRTKHPALAKNISSLSNYPAALPPALQGVDICERHPMFDLFDIAVKPIFTFDSYDSAAAVVAGSDAWSFFPDVLLSHYQKQLRTLQHPKTWHAPYEISLVTHRSRSVGRLAVELGHLLTKKFKMQI